MVVIINNRKSDPSIADPNSLVIEYESNITLNKGILKSLDQLANLQDIASEVRHLLNITHWRTMVMPSFSKVTVTIFDENEYDRICKIVNRDSVINDILKLS